MDGGKSSIVYKVYSPTLLSTGGRNMKIWAKYLIIGWSIVTVGIIIVSFQLMKNHFIEETYEVWVVYKDLEEAGDLELIAQDLFYNKDVFDTLNPSITKKEFVERMKKAKRITIESKNKIKDKSIYLFLPLYAFAVWMIPILVFSLIGLLFSRKAEGI
jgi:hypothetical protein